MLVLSLYAGESVQVGNSIVTFKKSTSDNKIKVTFDAPKEVQIKRLGMIEPKKNDENEFYQYPQLKDL